MTHEQSPGEHSNDDFDRIVRHETGEPLLGPRQGALVDALIQRLAEGGPMNEYDIMTAAWLGKVLNLDMTIIARELPAIEQ